MTDTSLTDGSAHGLKYLFKDKPEKGEIREIAEGVLWLRLPLFKGLDHINVWLLEDTDGWIIVDTGLNNDATKEVWEQVFDQTLNGKPVSKVIVTHMHPDHVGLAGWLCEKFDAPLYMSRLEYLTCRMLSADTGQPAPDEALRFLREIGSTPELIENYKQRFGGFGMAIYRLPQSYIRLSQGEEIEINGRIWQIEMGNGHSPEHICLHCPSLKLLISGDQVLPRISSHVGIFPNEPEANNMQDWIDSCHRLIERLPSDLLVLPAHNEPFYGIHERLQSLIDGHERRLARLLELCRTPRHPNDAEIFSTLFRRQIDADTFIMAATESMAHLNCLQRRGKLSKQLDENGVLIFASI